MWKKVKKGLSAGRVQSVAVRLIIDREKEIKDFIPEEYWTINGEFLKGKESFEGSFYGIDNKKVELTSRRRSRRSIKSNGWQYFTVETVRKKNEDAIRLSPFTTSSFNRKQPES